MSTYLLINVFIIAFPFLASFEKRVAYYKKWPALLFSILTVGGVFVLWDSWVTSRGDWSFNPTHVGTTKLLGLPIEEMLFFATVPYSCLFLYEVLNYFLPKTKILKLKKSYFFISGIGLMFLALLFKNQEYTVLALLAAASFLLLAPIISFKLLQNSNFWRYLGIGFILFVIFNYVLTSMPIVSYNPQAIWNFRVLTIPLEDFFYNFSLLSWYLLAYHKIKRSLPSLIKSKNKEV